MTYQANTSLFSRRCVLGTAGLGGLLGKVNPAESIWSVLQALDSGCQAIDTSPSYGDAEMYVGIALMQWQGALPEISTKAGRLKSFSGNDCYYDYSDDGLERSVCNSLYTLNVPAVDTLFLHEPCSLPVSEVARVVEKMVGFKERGLAKKIGLGGNFPSAFKPYLSAGVFDVVMGFNRFNACRLDDLNATVPFCIEKNIDYYLASPLYMGLLGSSFHLFTKHRPGWLDEECIARAMGLKRIADKYRMRLSSLAHRFLLGFDLPFRIVVGAANPLQLRNTIDDFNAGSLPEDLYNEILASIQYHIKH